MPMIGSVAHESEILTQVLSFRNDPYGFVMWMYPCGQPGTPFERLTGPRQWQVEELKLIGEHTRNQEAALAAGLPVAMWRSAYSSGRGPGKSALGGMLAHWNISTHLGAMTIVVANSETQLRTTTFPEYSKWFTAGVNAHWFDIEGMKISVDPWLADLVRDRKIDPEKWVVKGKTWTAENPSGYVGEHNDHGLLSLFDEASGIDATIWDRNEGFYTEVNPYRYWVATSQMRNRQGRFFDLFNDRQLGAGWRTRTLSTRGMPGVDQAVVEDQIKRYGEDSDYVRVEIHGLPPRTSEDQFIPWNVVKEAQQNDLPRDWGEPLILGIDPAPRGKTAWRFRQGRNARDCCGAATKGSWLGADNVEIAENIIKLDQKYQPDDICIDFGMGTGVIDVLKRRRTHGRVHTVKFGDTPVDKKSEWATHAIELWARVREWLPGGMIEKDDGEKGTLSQQLTDRGWRYSGREDGKKILETKDDMQRRGVKSPDDADALAITFEVNPPRRDVKARRGGGVAPGTGRSMTDG